MGYLVSSKVILQFKFRENKRIGNVKYIMNMHRKETKEEDLENIESP